MGTYANARLDLLIMPAFLAASSVGIYSVATSVSWIVVVLSGTLALIALPLATRSETGGSEVVWRLLRTTTVVAGVVAIGLGVAAPEILRLVYGSEFVAATDALRILLPGSVLFAGAFVLISGLFSANRPLSATVSQGAGALVTVAGLALFLDSGGIIAAAIVSSIAYTVVFVTALYLYVRAVRQWESRPQPGSVETEGPRDVESSLAAANVAASEASPRDPGA